MLKDRLDTFVTALGETTKTISIHFIRQGANFIQTNNSSMQLLGDYGNMLALDSCQTLLKILSTLMTLQDIDKVSSRTNLVKEIPSSRLE